MPARTQSKQMLTATEFYAQSYTFDELHCYELYNGIVQKSLLGSMQTSIISARIGSLIGIYLLGHDIGHLTGADGAYILSEYDVLLPKVGFISYERLPYDVDGFVPQAPDLAVEVISPYDSIAETQYKAEKYLSVGTKLVWIVYPKTETVDVCRLTEAGELHITEMQKDETLSGEDVLPDFTLAVKDIFALKKSS
jgi:Uma2 family endonuclease